MMSDFSIVFEYQTQLQQRKDALEERRSILIESRRYEECVPVYDALLNLPDPILSDYEREMYRGEKCQCLGNIALTNNLNLFSANAYLTFSKGILDELPMSKYPSLLDEVSIHRQRMLVFYFVDDYDSALNESKLVLHLNPVSEEGYLAYWIRAGVFGSRQEFQSMKIALDSAVRLRDLGYAKGREHLVDHMAAIYESYGNSDDFAGEIERRLARKRALRTGEDRIPYDPSSTNEENFRALTFTRFEDRILSESNYIPVLCSYRKRIDAMIHLATDSGDQIFFCFCLSSTQIAKHAVLRISDIIKSPLLLFALQHPKWSLSEFHFERLLYSRDDTLLLYPDEGLIVAYHLIFDCEICSDCLIRWVIRNGRIVHCDRVSLVRDELFPQLLKWIDFLPSLLESWGVGDSQIAELTTRTARRQQAAICQRLHSLLLGGIEHYLSSETHVTFVPDRELFRVPFGCLLDSNGQYLIEKCSFSVSSSLQLIGENAKQKEMVFRVPSDCEHLCSVVVCGNPKTPRRVDRVSTDVSDVADFLGDFFGSAIPVVTQDQFYGPVLREFCRLLRPHAVHIISHGSSDDIGDPANIMTQFRISGSLLCSNGTELLAKTVAETFDLRGIDLVFLNACDLAVGHTKELGLLGFNRAVFQAGCPSVISALWQVFPELSTAIAKTFYRLYFGGSYDKAEALRAAILGILSKRVAVGRGSVAVRDCPVLWAPYQLFGNRL